jgi:ParB/RepB/Spo0J family partition protein
MVMKCKLSEIYISSTFNCRKDIDQTKVMELADSIKEIGLLQPLVVNKHEKNGYKYSLVAGFRRYHALEFLGREEVEIKAIDVDPIEAQIINIIENTDREDLSKLEEANAVKKLVNHFGLRETCKKLGKTAYWVNTRLKFLNLPKNMYKHEECLTSAVINDLLEVKDKAGDRQMWEAFQRVVNGSVIKIDKHTKTNRRRTVHETEILLQKLENHDSPNINTGLHIVVAAWAIGEASDKDLAAAIVAFE